MLRVPGSIEEPVRRQGRRRRRSHRLFAARCAETGEDQSRPSGRFLRRRIRNHGSRQRHGRVAGRSRPHREFLAAGFACPCSSRDGGPALVRQLRGARISGRRPRLHHHGLRRIFSHRGALQGSDRRHRLRAARHSRRHSHDGQPTRRRPPRSREPVRARHAPRRQSPRAGAHHRSLRSREPAVARARRNSHAAAFNCADVSRNTMPTAASRSPASRHRNRRSASAD